MSDIRRVHNPGPYEMVFNRNGNILPGFTSVITDITDTITARLLRQNRLILPVEPEPEPEPAPEPAPEPETAPEEAPATAEATPATFARKSTKTIKSGE